MSRLQPAPFIERDPGGFFPPHVRVGFLVYSRSAAWFRQPFVRHLFGPFWWREWDWEYVKYWLGLRGTEA